MRFGDPRVRIRALLGGAAFLTAAVLWHRSSLDHGTAGSNPLGCTASNDGSICDAVTGISKATNSPLLLGNRAEMLPPPETPGATDPAISQANIDKTICRPGYARSVRPAYAITGPLKRRMMDAQHPRERITDYELDHLIPISIGARHLICGICGFSRGKAQPTPATRTSSLMFYGGWSAPTRCRSRLPSTTPAGTGRVPISSTRRPRTSRSITSDTASRSASSSS